LEKVEFLGLKNCLRIANDQVDLIATTDIGPNVVRFGFIGDRNEFFGEPPRFYGGHAMRHAPEDRARKFPANDPVKVEQHDKFVRLTQPTEIPTGIQKEMDIPTTITGNHITVTNRLYNRGLWPVELAPWAYTLMTPGGKGIVPLPAFIPQMQAPVLPTACISLWAYNDMSDPRLVMGKKYVVVKQDSKVPGSFKFGMMVKDGWTAYWNNGHLFIATFEFKPGRTYPDYNNTVQFWTGPGFELETLAPYSTLQPGESSELTENWFLYKDVPEPKNDSDLDNYVLPLVKKSLSV
jgi:hypothetical protein